MSEDMKLEDAPAVVGERAVIFCCQSHERHLQALFNSQRRELTDQFLGHCVDLESPGLPVRLVRRVTGG